MSARAVNKGGTAAENTGNRRSKRKARRAAAERDRLEQERVRAEADKQRAEMDRQRAELARQIAEQEKRHARQKENGAKGDRNARKRGKGKRGKDRSAVDAGAVYSGAGYGGAGFGAATGQDASDKGGKTASDNGAKSRLTRLELKQAKLTEQRTRHEASKRGTLSARQVKRIEAKQAKLDAAQAKLDAKRAVRDDKQARAQAKVARKEARKAALRAESPEVRRARRIYRTGRMGVFAIPILAILTVLGQVSTDAFSSNTTSYAHYLSSGRFTPLEIAATWGTGLFGVLALVGMAALLSAGRARRLALAGFVVGIVGAAALIASVFTVVVRATRVAGPLVHLHFDQVVVNAHTTGTLAAATVVGGALLLTIGWILLGIAAARTYGVSLGDAAMIVISAPLIYLGGFFISALPTVGAFLLAAASLGLMVVSSRLAPALLTPARPPVRKPSRPVPVASATSAIARFIDEPDEIDEYDTDVIADGTPLVGVAAATAVDENVVYTAAGADAAAGAGLDSGSGVGSHSMRGRGGASGGATVVGPSHSAPSHSAPSHNAPSHSAPSHSASSKGGGTSGRGAHAESRSAGLGRLSRGISTAWPVTRGTRPATPPTTPLPGFDAANRDDKSASAAGERVAGGGAESDKPSHRAGNDRAGNDRASADFADGSATEKPDAERLDSEKPDTEKHRAGMAATDKAVSDRDTTDQAVNGHASAIHPTDRSATDQGASDRGATEHRAADQGVTDKSAMGQGASTHGATAHDVNGQPRTSSDATDRGANAGDDGRARETAEGVAEGAAAQQSSGSQAGSNEQPMMLGTYQPGNIEFGNRSSADDRTVKSGDVNGDQGHGGGEAGATAGASLERPATNGRTGSAEAAGSAETADDLRRDDSADTPIAKVANGEDVTIKLRDASPSGGMWITDAAGASTKIGGNGGPATHANQSEGAAPTDRSSTDGASADGASTDAASTDRPSTDRPSTEAAPTDRPSTEAPQADLARGDAATPDSPISEGATVRSRATGGGEKAPTTGHAAKRAKAAGKTSVGAKLRDRLRRGKPDSAKGPGAGRE